MEISTQSIVEQWHLVALGSFLYFVVGILVGRVVYRRGDFPKDSDNSSVGVIAGIFWPFLLAGIVIGLVVLFLVFLVTFKNGGK